MAGIRMWSALVFAGVYALYPAAALALSNAMLEVFFVKQIVT